MNPEIWGKVGGAVEDDPHHILVHLDFNCSGRSWEFFTRGSECHEELKENYYE